MDGEPWLSFLKVLVGTRLFDARSVVVLCWRGHSGRGSPSFSRSAYVSILFLFFSYLPLALGVCLLLPQHFVTVDFIWLLLYLYSGATAYFVSVFLSLWLLMGFNLPVVNPARRRVVTGPVAAHRASTRGSRSYAARNLLTWIAQTLTEASIPH